MKKVLSSIVALSLLFLGGIAFADEGPYPAPKNSNKNAAMHNSEGISHFNEGHWNVAVKHFQEAIKADKKFAIGHYNLALALDRGGQHGAAADYFKKALELGPDDKNIKNSKILKAHTGHAH